MLKNIIKDISNLNEREERVIYEMITKKLFKNEKKTYIIIIKISRDFPHISLISYQTNPN